MSNLKSVDRLKFEKLFEMDSGYVLNFSNSAFQGFIFETTGINIYDKKYKYSSGSKANRLRAFWKEESNYTVSKLNSALLEYWKTLKKYEIDEKDQKLYEECLSINEKIKKEAIGDHIEVIQPNADEEDFSLLAKSIRESIQNNEPENALDRLHTFVVKYIRRLCNKHNIKYDKDKPLHSLFGEYVKYLKNKGIIESQMTERILKSSVSILEAFNQVRNNQSFAHDNIILNHNESMLIFKNISSIIEFIKSIEYIKGKNENSNDWDELPF